MQARITQDGEIVVVHLIGRLDVETAEPFRDACLKHLVTKKVVFSFRELSFVGSSGILPFLETMQQFAQNNREGLKFCAVGSEFRKVLSATPLMSVEVLEDEAQAVHALRFPRPVSPVNSPAAVEAAPKLADSESDEMGPVKPASSPGTEFGLLSLRAEPEAGSQDPAYDDGDHRGT